MYNLRLHLLILLGLAVSCQEVVPEFDNPLDPGNPQYKPPMVTIIAGPSNDEVIYTSTVRFEWMGNDLVTVYRHKFNEDDWTPWSDSREAFYGYLNEARYSFQVQSAYPNGDTSSIVQVKFYVDAVQGPALMFYPRMVLASAGDTVNFQVMAEEVDSLTAADFTLGFDPNKMVVLNVTEGSFFSGTGETIFQYQSDSYQGVIHVLVALLGGLEPSKSGTGSLVNIALRTTGIDTSVIFFDGSEILRDPNNNNILVNEIIDGYVISP